MKWKNNKIENLIDDDLDLSLSDNNEPDNESENSESKKFDSD